MKALVSQFFYPERNGLAVISTDLFKRFNTKFDFLITLYKGRKEKKILEIVPWNDIKIQEKEYDYSFNDKFILKDKRISEICFSVGIGGYAKKFDLSKVHLISSSNDWILLYPFYDQGLKPKILLTIEGGGKKTVTNLNYLKNKIIKKVVTHITVPSIHLKDQIKKIIDVQKITCIPNYVDTDFFKPSKRTLNKNLRVLYLGRLHEGKGIIDILRTAKKCKDVNFLLIGDPGEPNFLSNINGMVQKSNLKNIKIKSGLNHNKTLLNIFHRSDIFIYPTYGSTLEGYGCETCPFSILEAMSTELPVISSDVDGIPEIIENEKNGILVRPGEFGDIVKSIDYLRDENVRKVMGVKSRRKAIKKYDIEKIMHRYEKLYAELGF